MVGEVNTLNLFTTRRVAKHSGSLFYTERDAYDGIMYFTRRTQPWPGGIDSEEKSASLPQLRSHPLPDAQSAVSPYFVHFDEHFAASPRT